MANGTLPAHDHVFHVLYKFFVKKALQFRAN